MFSAQQVPYQQTASFAKIIIDYLDGKEELKPFYSFPPALDGIQQAIEAKQKQNIDRELLVQELQNQYTAVGSSQKVADNIAALLQENTFTVCTAHQPNLFTGPLYFIYKILHVIKLAVYLQEQLPEYHFVPVYYMGSEDADLAELNHIYVEGKKYEWLTGQKGAVGRMSVDQKLLNLIEELEGQLSIYPFGKEFLALLRKSYVKGKAVQNATFELVHALFQKWGLLVLVPDDAAFKKIMMPVFEEDLFQQQPSAVVQATSEQLGTHYDVQAHPRAINLFYLKDDMRERIVQQGESYQVNNTKLSFSQEELKDELTTHPERFSPNVILRGLYQETLLPNIAFVGGGGELAYWLQLKGLFQHYSVPFPVLVLRNSFLIVERKWKDKMNKLQLNNRQLFLSETELMNQWVLQRSAEAITLNGTMEKAEQLYEQIKQQAEEVDPTLAQHVMAIKTKSINTLKTLEQKMLRAEKRKFSDQQKQLQQLKTALFPNSSLQERVGNIGTYYAKWGPAFIDALYTHSLTLEQQFMVLTEE